MRGKHARNRPTSPPPLSLRVSAPLYLSWLDLTSHVSCLSITQFAFFAGPEPLARSCHHPLADQAAGFSYFWNTSLPPLTKELPSAASELPNAHHSWPPFSSGQWGGSGFPEILLGRTSPFSNCACQVFSVTLGYSVFLDGTAEVRPCSFAWRGGKVFLCNFDMAECHKLLCLSPTFGRERKRIFLKKVVRFHRIYD
jgi:hypothetical protein